CGFLRQAGATFRRPHPYAPPRGRDRARLARASSRAPLGAPWRAPLRARARRARRSSDAARRRAQPLHLAKAEAFLRPPPAGAVPRPPLWSLVLPRSARTGTQLPPARQGGKPRPNGGDVEGPPRRGSCRRSPDNAAPGVPDAEAAAIAWTVGRSDRTGARDSLRSPSI